MAANFKNRLLKCSPEPDCCFEFIGIYEFVKFVRVHDLIVGYSYRLV